MNVTLSDQVQKYFLHASVERECTAPTGVRIRVLNNGTKRVKTTWRNDFNGLFPHPLIHKSCRWLLHTHTHKLTIVTHCFASWTGISVLRELAAKDSREEYILFIYLNKKNRPVAKAFHCGGSRWPEKYLQRADFKAVKQPAPLTCHRRNNDVTAINCAVIKLSLT